MANYGSFHNLMFSNGKYKTPEVGMGATELCWSDRHAYTIVEVVNDKTIVVQRDDAIRVDNYGMTDAQKYEYNQNTNNNKCTVTLRKNGRWVTSGQRAKGGTTWMIGSREEYYDFTF